jgi:acetamidase/formamidase
VARHELPLDRRHLHGHFSRELEPVVTIDPGDSVRISVPNAGWRLESGELFEPRSDELDAGHALAGPIEIRGARAGHTLAARIDGVQPGSWGMTFTDPPHFVRWELADGRGRSERTADAWITFGFDEDLGCAARIATKGMVDLLGRERGLSREDALALASVVVDLRVTQVVNEAQGVHAVLRDDAVR